MDLLILDIYIVESASMGCVVTGFFYLAKCFQGSSMLYPYFIPFYGQMMECIGLAFENKAGKLSYLFFFCLVSFFLGSQSLHVEMKREIFSAFLYLSNCYFS